MTGNVPMGTRNPILHNTRLCLIWLATINGCCNGVGEGFTSVTTVSWDTSMNF